MICSIIIYHFMNCLQRKRKKSIYYFHKFCFFVFPAHLTSKILLDSLRATEVELPCDKMKPNDWEKLAYKNQQKKKLLKWQGIQILWNHIYLFYFLVNFHGLWCSDKPSSLKVQLFNTSAHKHHFIWISFGKYCMSTGKFESNDW